MRRVLALTGHGITATEGINEKALSPSSWQASRLRAVVILNGARIGGQHQGLHLVVRGPNPRRSIFFKYSSDTSVSQEEFTK